MVRSTLSLFGVVPMACRSILRLGGFFVLPALCFLAASTANGQGTDLKPYRLEPKQPTGELLTKMNDLYSGKVRIKGPDIRGNQAILKQFAQYAMYRVTFDSYYNLPESGELKPRTVDQNLDLLVSDLNSRLLIPTPERDLPRMNPEQTGYIIEYGAALDAAVADIFAKNPPAIIRVNAARFLSIAAKSGAPAHGKTLTAMLNNTYFKDKAGKPLPTPPEVLIYAIHGAENFLAAYDVTALNSPLVTRHALPDAELVVLVKILDDMVLKGPPVAALASVSSVDASGRPTNLTPPPPMGGEAATTAPAAPPATATALLPEQIAVVRYYRRAAIRALAKIRYDVVGGKGVPEVRVGYTLAKVATNDSTLSLSTTPADAAEAVIGLANNALPSVYLNVDVWALALAQGLGNMAAPRLAEDADVSLPWKQTAARVSASFAQLRKNIAVTPRYRGYGKPLTDLLDLAIVDILSPLEKDTQAGVNRPSVERLQLWITGNPPKDAAGSLFNDDAKYKFAPRRPGT